MILPTRRGSSRRAGGPRPAFAVRSAVRDRRSAVGGRPGFALLAALWLVVAIAAVALQFALEARERRQLGLGASDRGLARAAALGGLAIARSRLEYVLREARLRTGGQAAARLRSFDPWLDVDTLFADTIAVGGVAVRVAIEDANDRLNVNDLSADEWRTFLGRLLNDYTTADELAQAILDWEDPDDQARPRGAERDRYVAEERLVLPPNRPLRDVGELQDVRGMTPEIFAAISPYLTAQGSGRVNPNTAPPEVLRALPGMTDDLVIRIMGFRSAHVRIRSINDIVPAVPPAGRRGGPPARGGPAARSATMQQRLASRLVFDTAELRVIVTARPSAASASTELQAVVQRSNNTQSQVTWRSW